MLQYSKRTDDERTEHCCSKEGGCERAGSQEAPVGGGEGDI